MRRQLKNLGGSARWIAALLMLLASLHAAAQPGPGGRRPAEVDAVQAIVESSDAALEETLGRVVAPAMRARLGDEGVRRLADELRAAVKGAGEGEAEPLAGRISLIEFRAASSRVMVAVVGARDGSGTIEHLSLGLPGTSSGPVDRGGVDAADAKKSAEALLAALSAKGDRAEYVAANVSERMKARYGPGVADLLEALSRVAGDGGRPLRVTNVLEADGGWDVVVDGRGYPQKLRIYLTTKSGTGVRVDGFGMELRAAPGAVASKDVAKTIEAFVKAETEAGRFSGTVLVAKDGKPIVSMATGLADREAGRPNTVDAPINLGSMNKMFTSVAVAQLVAAGKIAWTDKVGKFLPHYPNQRVRDEVTIDQLMSHTSGIPGYWNAAYAAKRDEITTLQGFADTFAREPLEFAPGTDYRYSNGGPVVLGLIVEAVSGESYYDYVRKHIYGPAGMKHSDHYLKTDTQSGIAVGYERRGPGGTPEPNTATLGMRGSSAGGGYSTGEDLLRFAAALENGTLLPKPALEELWRQRHDRDPSSGFGYGFLWGSGAENGKRWVGHNGGAPGISADFRYFPEERLVVVVLANQGRAAMGVSNWIVEMMTGR